MGVDLIHLWAQMGWFAKGIVFVMAIMSVYSLTIVITKLIQIKRSEDETRRFARRSERRSDPGWTGPPTSPTTIASRWT